MKKMRKQVSGFLKSWDHDLEPGQRVFDSFDGKVYDLCESNGRNKAASGELSYKEPVAQKKGKIATEINGIWYWQ